MKNIKLYEEWFFNKKKKLDNVEIKQAPYIPKWEDDVDVDGDNEAMVRVMKRKSNVAIDGADKFSQNLVMDDVPSREGTEWNIVIDIKTQPRIGDIVFGYLYDDTEYIYKLDKNQTGRRYHKYYKVLRAVNKNDLNKFKEYFNHTTKYAVQSMERDRHWINRQK